MNGYIWSVTFDTPTVVGGVVNAGDQPYFYANGRMLGNTSSRSFIRLEARRTLERSFSVKLFYVESLERSHESGASAQSILIFMISLCDGAKQYGLTYKADQSSIFTHRVMVVLRMHIRTLEQPPDRLDSCHGLLRWTKRFWE